MAHDDNDIDRYFSDPDYRKSKSRVNPNARKGSSSPRKGSSFSMKSISLKWIGGIVAFLIIATAVFIWYLSLGLPSIDELENPRTDVASLIKSREGVVIDKFFYENRTTVPIENISPNVVNALIATEDHRFYSHWGVDMKRMASLPFYFIQGKFQGGSTIAMQLARNLYQKIGREVNVTRKLREMITAVQIERNYTKEEILEMYLNTVEFSNSSFGIEAAAFTHFGKRASELTVPEAAVLIGGLKGIYMFNPRVRPERSLSRRNTVLDLMHQHGYITEMERDAYKAEPIALDYHPPFRAGRESRYFGEYIRTQLSEWLTQNGYDLYRDGLVIYTTIDGRMQKHAETALQARVDSLQPIFQREWTSRGGSYMDLYWRRFPDFLDSFIRETQAYREGLRDAIPASKLLDSLKMNETFVDSVKRARTRLEAGFVAIEPSTGHIIAWVGGTNYGSVQYDHVNQMKRQPGSTFKPFVYAVAVDNGYSPFYKLSILPKRFSSRSSQTWSPSDASTPAGLTSVTMSAALARSYNNATVNLLPLLAGNPETDNLEDLEPAARKIVAMAKNVGIKSPLNPYPAIALGTEDVSLLEMASAYTTFASGGVYNEPLAILRIEDKDGNVLREFFPREQREAISPETAYTVVDMLRGSIQGVDAGDGVRRGTAVRLANQFGVRQDIAGKTGTTQNSADNWFIAMTPALVMGAWVGGDDRRTRFPERTSLGEGARMALPIVGEFIFRCTRDKEIAWSYDAFVPPDGYIPPQPFQEERRQTDTTVPDARRRTNW
jgi:penicillin-binding protein 1A